MTRLSSDLPVSLVVFLVAVPLCLGIALASGAPLASVTPTNRGLKAQGVGNIISGLLGGLPVTQVIVRSSASIQSGARSKASAILHGVPLLLAVGAVPALLNRIPLATLAAILLTVGYKLAKPALFRTMYALGRGQFLPFIVTIVGILATDLLVGVGLGMAVAVFQILLTNYSNPYFLEGQPHEPGGVWRIALTSSSSRWRSRTPASRCEPFSTVVPSSSTSSTTARLAS